MDRVEQKLAEWDQLVKDLEDARARLKATPAGPDRTRLKAEVRRLTVEGDLALDAISEAIAAEHESMSNPEDGGTPLLNGGVGHSGTSSWSQRRKGLRH